MEAPDQNKIMGKEIAVAKANYMPIDDKKSGWVFKESFTVDTLVMELNAITLEVLEDCVDQLNKMGSYDELSKEQGNDKGGYKPTGLVIPSKLDPRVVMSVEFGHRWNKDSDQQAEIVAEKPVTLKWFLNDEHQGQHGMKGVAPEHSASAEELDIITKLREITKLPESRQPVLEAIKRGYRTMSDNNKSISAGEFKAGLKLEEHIGDPPSNPDAYKSKPEAVKQWIRTEIRKFGTASLLSTATATANGADEVLKIMKSMVDSGEITNDELVEDHNKGEDMKEGRSDWESVDFFGLPIDEEIQVGDMQKKADSPYVDDPSKKDKEVDKMSANLKPAPLPPKAGPGSAIAKPASEQPTGVKSGEAPHKDTNIKTGDAEDGNGEIMQGKGSSDDQQKDLPSKEIKTGKAADGHGKVMGDSKKTVGKTLDEARKKKMDEWRKKKMKQKMQKRYGKK